MSQGTYSPSSLPVGGAAGWSATSLGLPILTTGDHSLSLPFQHRRGNSAVIGLQVQHDPLYCSLLKSPDLSGHLSGAGTLADTENKQ